MPILLLSEAIEDRVLSPRVLLFSSRPWEPNRGRTMIATMEGDILINIMHIYTTIDSKSRNHAQQIVFLKKDVSSTLSLWSEFRMHPDLNEILKCFMFHFNICLMFDAM